MICSKTEIWMVVVEKIRQKIKQMKKMDYMKRQIRFVDEDKRENYRATGKIEMCQIQ